MSHTNARYRSEENSPIKEQRNKGTKEQKNKGTKKQKVHPFGSSITRSPGLVFLNPSLSWLQFDYVPSLAVYLLTFPGTLETSQLTLSLPGAFSHQDPTLYYIVYCILYTVYCILYTVYCILYTVYCILYTVYSILYTVYCILYTVYYTILYFIV